MSISGNTTAFNVGDSGITVGVTIFLFLQIFEGDEDEKNPAKGKNLLGKSFS
jgi:lipoprotein signal peptidase